MTIDATEGNREKERLLAQATIIETLGLVLSFAGAWLADSLILYADLANEGVDTAGTVFAWLIFRSLRRRQHEFDYGTGKVESLITLNSIILLALTIYWVGAEAIDRLLHPEPLENVSLGLFMTIAWIFVDAYFWKKAQHLDRLYPSSLMKSFWKSYKAGFWISLAISLTVGFSKWLEPYRWSWYIDPIVSFVYLGYLVKITYELSMEVLNDLSDHAIDESLQLVIVKELGRHIDDYVQIVSIKTRHVSNQAYIYLHLEFAPDLMIREAMDRKERIEDDLAKQIRGSEVLVVPTRREAAEGTSPEEDEE